MILRRLGNKQAIAQDIIKYFPEHKIYVEPFFGAGGMFFNKHKVKYNILNDIDSDVFNLFQVVKDRKDDLVNSYKKMPIHSDLLDYWGKNEENEPVNKALRFLALSNFVLNGRGGTLRLGATGGSQGVKNSFYNEIDKCFEFVNDAQFTNKDFRVFFKSYSLDDRAGKGESNQTFIYCDPPYLGTNDNYSNSFTKQDSIDLFDCLKATGCKFAMSEFDNEFILNQAKERGLNVIIIGERKNLKNRRTEILITNYEKQKGLFD
jgi:DNA adenine methylase